MILESLNIATLGLSLVLFVLFIVLVLYIMTYVSIVVAAIILLIIPIAAILLLPDTSIQFLATEQYSFADGLVPVYNLHILLFIWASLLSVIISTEFITWYILREPAYEAKKGKAPKVGDISKKAFDLERLKQIFAGLSTRIKLAELSESIKPKTKPAKTQKVEKKESSKFSKPVQKGATVNLGPLNGPLLKFEAFINSIPERLQRRS